MQYSFQLTTSCACKGAYSDGVRITHDDIVSDGKTTGRHYSIDVRHPSKADQLKKAKGFVEELDFYKLNPSLTEEQLVSSAMSRQGITLSEATKQVRERVEVHNKEIRQALEVSSVLDELRHLK